jgi:hypothetical protein
VEPEVRAYLKRILNSIAIAALWLLSNTTAGLQFELAYINNPISAGNIIFYCWLPVSSILFVRYIIRLWRNPLNIPR